MNRFNSFALSAASATFAYFAGVNSKSRNVEKTYENRITPDLCFLKAKDNLLTATVQQSIYRLGDPNVALSRPIIFRENYVLSYDERMRNPKWVFEKITQDDLGGEADRGDCSFKSDPEIDVKFRAQNVDFKGTGYDRGHLAAAANHSRTPSVMNETFLLSNISPQHPSLNRKLWNKLEAYTRGCVKNCDAVYVCSGPLYLPQEEDGKLIVKYQLLGERHVAVPTHYFKIILLEKGSDLEIKSYVMPNSEEAEFKDEKPDLKKYYVSVDAIERAAGLIFFSNLFKKKFEKTITKINDQPVKQSWF